MIRMVSTLGRQKGTQNILIWCCNLKIEDVWSLSLCAQQLCARHIKKHTHQYFTRDMPYFTHWSDGISAVLCMNVYVHAEHSRYSITPVSKIWHISGKIYLHYVKNVVNCTVRRFSWSVKLLTSEDEKLERLNLSILFTISEVFWVK